MSRGDGQHSFGHGRSCYWCGLYGDDAEIAKPCDERERRKPTEGAMAHFGCTMALEDARTALEEAELECDKAGYRETAKDVYDVRLRLSDTLRRFETMRPKE